MLNAKKKGKCHRSNIEPFNITSRGNPHSIENGLKIAKNAFYDKTMDWQCNMSNTFNLEAHAYAADI